MSEIEFSEGLVAPPNHHRAVSAAARLNIAAWATLAAVTAVDCVLMQRAGFTVAPGFLARYTAGPLMIAFAAAILRGISYTPRYSRLASRLPVRKGCTLADGLAVMTLFTYAALILQYLCVSLAPPVIDEGLIALDAALGFHWPDLYAWQIKHHFASLVLSGIYVSYTPQVVLAIVMLALTKRADDLADFVLLFMASVVAAILISAPFPASNPMIHFGFYGPSQDSPWSQFYALREGATRVINLSKEQGLISMPSLHAADAVLFVYAVRNIRWLLPMSVMWNAVMIYSAIPFGAHYLVDIFAGVLLAGILIAALRRWHAYVPH